MRRARGDSPSSSIDSSSHPCPSSTSSIAPPTRGGLSTDLRLGMSISTSIASQRGTCCLNSASGDRRPNWPPIKPLLRSTLAGKGGVAPRQQATFFVKVYMDGIPIGRKVDLLAHHTYNELTRTLGRMFRTGVICPDLAPAVSSNKTHVLTYEDKEGDWMMVGDVPWEMFVASVKRLKITKADKR